MNAELFGHLFDGDRAFRYVSVVFGGRSSHIVGQVLRCDQFVYVLFGGEPDHLLGLGVQPGADQFPDLVEYPGQLVDAHIHNSAYG